MKATTLHKIFIDNNTFAFNFKKFNKKVESENHDYQLIIKNIKFSKREVDVLTFVIQRMSSKEIAINLNISHNTVNNHVNSIIKKIDGTCRRDIISFINKNDSLDVFKYNIGTQDIRNKKHLFKSILLIFIASMLLLCTCVAVLF